MPAENQRPAARRTAAANRPLAFALAALAAVASEAAVRRFADVNAVLIFAAAATAAVAVAVAATELLQRRFPSLGAEPRSTCGWTAAAVAVALGIETAVRVAAGVPPLLDVLLLAFIRDVVIVLALLSHHARARHLCVGLAAFLALAASATADDPRVQAVVIIFVAVAGWWLAGEHWDSLRGRLVASSTTKPSARRSAGFPAMAVALPLLLPVYGLSTRAIDGFMPTSGGRRDTKASARSGVGDGDALVAGLHNIRSFGPIEDAPFVNGHEPSLYDMYDDTYSEPVARRHERSISLPPQARGGGQEQSLATAGRAGREFSTVRRSDRSSTRRLADLDTAALFYVKGRVPLHLKLESFALYDGVSWLPEEIPHPEPPLEIATVRNRPWLRLAPLELYDFYAAPETHAIKVVRLDTNRIPTPNRLMAVHIDGVAQADFFTWAQPGLVRIERDTIPGLLTVHLQSQVVDTRRFPGSRPCFFCGGHQYLHMGDDPQSQQVKELAESWVAGVPRGLPQIERIVERLRSGYEHDPAARVGGAKGHSVAEFLLESRRGPDYLFASAAVCALRSLGYAARLVSGFHADPRRYDAGADHTPVLPQDVHFWAEVTIGANQWLSLEPTPGYTLLAPQLSAWERLLAAAMVALTSLARHPFASLVAVVAAVAAWRWRRWMVDVVDGLCSRLWWQRGDRDAVLATLALLDRRCRRAGLPRPAHVTPPGWLASLHALVSTSLDAEDFPHEARAFVRLADEALYSPCFRLPPSTDPRRIADRLWPWKRLAAVSAARARPPSSHRAPFPTRYLPVHDAQRPGERR